MKNRKRGFSFYRNGNYVFFFTLIFYSLFFSVSIGVNISILLYIHTISSNLVHAKFNIFLFLVERAKVVNFYKLKIIIINVNDKLLDELHVVTSSRKYFFNTFLPFFISLPSLPPQREFFYFQFYFSLVFFPSLYSKILFFFYSPLFFFMSPNSRTRVTHRGMRGGRTPMNYNL